MRGCNPFRSQIGHRSVQCLLSMENRIWVFRPSIIWCGSQKFTKETDFPLWTLIIVVVWILRPPIKSSLNAELIFPWMALLQYHCHIILNSFVIWLIYLEIALTPGFLGLFSLSARYHHLWWRAWWFYLCCLCEGKRCLMIFSLWLKNISRVE